MNPKRRIWLRRTQMWPIDIALAALGVAILVAWAVAGAPVPPPLGTVPTPALTVGALSAPVGQPRTISGRAAPNARLILREDAASRAAATTADAAGYFTFDLPPASTPGPWNISIHAEADLAQSGSLGPLAPRWSSAPILVQGNALPLPTSTATPTASPTATASPSPSPTLTPASTSTSTSTPTPTPTPAASPSPTPTAAPRLTRTPAATPTAVIVAASSPTPTAPASTPVTDTATTLGDTIPLLPESGATPTQPLNLTSTPTSTF